MYLYRTCQLDKSAQPVTRIHFEQAWDEVLRDLRRKQSKRSIINKGPTTVQAGLLSGLFQVPAITAHETGASRRGARPAE